MSDPMEQLIEDALNAGSFRYVKEGSVKGSGQTLDFFLPDLGIYIEVKQFHSPRIADQMARAPNVIAAQGRPAVEMLARLLAAARYKGDTPC